MVILENKIIRWCIALSFACVLSWKACVHYSNNQLEQASIGVYKLDVLRSNFLGNYQDSFVFRELKLTLQSDHRFFFSQSVPFLIGPTGKWGLQYIDMADYLSLTFDSSEVIHQVGHNYDLNDLIFTSPSTANDNLPAETLIFNRVQ
jgi:hypothetical protein